MSSQIHHRTLSKKDPLGGVCGGMYVQFVRTMLDGLRLKGADDMLWSLLCSWPKAGMS